MEQDPTRPNSGEVTEWVRKRPQVLQVGSMKGILERRSGDSVSSHGVEGSLSLEQWEAQWKEFLRTVESSHSPWGIPSLPEKPSPWKDAKAFLASFEQVAEACQWPQEEWATQLLPALSGKAERAFNSLDVPDRENYGKVKAAILREDTLIQEKQRQQFRSFCYQEAEGPRGAYRRLWEMCRGWLRVENHSKEQILELLVLEQLLNVLPLEIRSRVRESGPDSCSQAVALAEEFLLRQEKQAPLEEMAGSVFRAGQDLSESEQRHPMMAIKEEEGGEAGPLGCEYRRSCRREHPMNQPTEEGSLSLKQWEVQWQEFLRTLEPSHCLPLPEKPSPWEDAKAFLASFEQVAMACQWPQEEGVTHLLPAPSGDAKQAFNRLDVQGRKDYGKVKAAILHGEAFSREKQHQQFRGFCHQGATGGLKLTWEVCRGWLSVETHSKEEILELLFLEQLLSVLPPEIQSRVRESGPESCSRVVALAEEPVWCSG